MAQIIKTEMIALFETENKAFGLVINILEGICRETGCKDIEELCGSALVHIYSFLELTE